MSWTIANFGLILSLAAEHLLLALPPIVFGFVIAVPLGWLAWRYRVTRGLVLTVAGLLYTIPSLALFVLLPPLFGIPFLSELNVTIALTLYAVALMARAAADAFGSVDAGVRQSAIAVGYSPWRRFWGVELPLAGPVLLAGVRVVAVSTIALVTVGVLIGVQSLGTLFTDGLQRRILEEVFAGIVATALLALAVDFALRLLGRLAMPWAAR